MSKKISEYLFFCVYLFFFFFGWNTPPHSPPPPKKKKNLQIWILCQNSLTRELKVRIVGFCTLKDIHIFCNVDFTTCFTLCKGLLFCILPLLTVWHTVSLSVFPPPPPPLPTHTPIRIFFFSDMDSLSKFTY